MFTFDTKFITIFMYFIIYLFYSFLTYLLIMYMTSDIQGFLCTYWTRTEITEIWFSDFFLIPYEIHFVVFDVTADLPFRINIGKARQKKNERKYKTKKNKSENKNDRRSRGRKKNGYWFVEEKSYLYDRIKQINIQ